MSEEEKGFIIRDRRMSAEEGKDEEGQTGDEQKSSEESSEESSKEKPEKSSSSEDEAQSESVLPEINFATFIFSLNSSALVHLGVIDEPGAGKKVKNLPLAKQVIDILGMLDEKTKGNLTDDEDKLLKNILHDLRLMYVKESG